MFKLPWQKKRLTFNSCADLKIKMEKVADVGFLTTMLWYQKQFDSKFWKEPLTIEQKQEWTVKLLWAMQQESAEVADAINWKWWSKHKKQIQIVELQYELIDQLHFLLALFNVWEMDAQTIYNMYNAKNKENFNRQERNY